LRSGSGVTDGPGPRFDDDNFSVADVDDEDNSWKVIAGFRFVDAFAVEANYIDFGNATTPSPGIDGAEAKAFALYGVGFLPLPWFDLFAELGAARIDS